MYGKHIPVEDLVQDVTPESVRNFLESDLVIVIDLFNLLDETSCHFAGENVLICL